MTRALLFALSLPSGTYNVCRDAGSMAWVVIALFGIAEPR